MKVGYWHCGSMLFCKCWRQHRKIGEATSLFKRPILYFILWCVMESRNIRHSGNKERMYCHQQLTVTDKLSLLSKHERRAPARKLAQRNGFPLHSINFHHFNTTSSLLPYLITISTVVYLIFFLKLTLFLNLKYLALSHVIISGELWI